MPHIDVLCEKTRERQGDRGPDRQTNRDRETEGQTDRDRQTETGRYTERETDRYIKNRFQLRYARKYSK